MTSRTAGVAWLRAFLEVELTVRAPAAAAAFAGLVALLFRAADLRSFLAFEMTWKALEGGKIEPLALNQVKRQRPRSQRTSSRGVSICEGGGKSISSGMQQNTNRATYAAYIHV